MFMNLHLLTDMHELVTINGQQVIIKTCDLDEVQNETFFQATLAHHGLPSLKIYNRVGLQENQIKMEYIKDGSPDVQGITPEFMYKWGNLLQRLHAIHFEDTFQITKTGMQKPLFWQEFLTWRLNDAKAKQALPADLVEEIEQVVTPLWHIQLSHASLLHGDAHSNNVLIRGEDLVLFDQGYRIRTGDPLYDVAIVHMGFSNGRYINTHNPDNLNDTTLLAAFYDGYGREFLEKNQATLDLYVLLRSFERHPNKFEPFLEKIIKKIVKNSKTRLVGDVDLGLF